MYVSAVTLRRVLAAVDVEGCPSDGGVRHQVDGHGGEILRTDDASYWQGFAQLFAPRVELVTEERCGQWRVDEGWCEHVDPDRREFEGKAPCKSGHGGGNCGDEWPC
jgi:hypothetical protein